MIRRKQPRPMLCPFCLADVIFEQRSEKRRNGYERNYLACPECEESIPRMYADDYRKFPPVVVSAVGFPQHGKTVYFSSLFYTLRHMDLVDRWPGFHTQCVNDESLDRLWQSVRELNRGQLPSATPKTIPQPTMLRIHGYPGVRDCTLVMYDTAGESFNRPNQLIQYARFVKRARTVLFFVSLPRIHEDDEEPDDVLHKLLETYIVGIRELGAQERRQNLVVVFTMADAVGERLGRDWESVREQLISVTPGDESQAGYARGMNALSQQLHRFVDQDLRARNFLQLSERFFASTSFSIVSSLGAAPDDDNTMATRVMPRRIFDPLLVVLKSSQPGIWDSLTRWV